MQKTGNGDATKDRMPDSSPTAMTESRAQGLHWHVNRIYKQVGIAGEGFAKKVSIFLPAEDDMKT